MEAKSPNSKNRMRFTLAPKVKQVFTTKIIVTGSALLAVFACTWLYFNLGRSHEAKAAGAAMTVVANGNWSATSTWSLSRVPGNGDTLTVPAGVTLTVDIVTASISNLHIMVYGTISFVSGKKIVMCPGEIRVYTGGKLVGASVGSKIDICTNMVWDGNDPGDGPLYFNGGALPIELISFGADVSGKSVEISWATANEINNDYFTLERSEDGENFYPLINIKGAGNSTSELYYQTKDSKPKGGMNYYRLKQTDYDGKFAYFNIVTVNVDNGLSDGSVNIESVSPNPFREDFTMKYSTKAVGTVNITLMNSMGSIVKQDSWSATEGNSTWHYTDSKNIAPGIYFLTLTMNDKVVTRRLIKS